MTDARHIANAELSNAVAPHPRILPIPAFDDNYLWLLRSADGRRAAVVDPGDARAVIERLEAEQLELSDVLVTHHHADHIGGLTELKRRFPGLRVHGPHNPRIEGIDQRYSAGQSLVLEGFEARFEVIEVPGHTLDHIAWFAPVIGSQDPRPVLFCGDTLFSGGCGRLFEGTAAQMHASLSRLAGLPPATLVYCAHEYTASNLRFARMVEPDSVALNARHQDVETLRAQGLPTIPSTLSIELATNPFMRSAESTVRRAAHARLGRDAIDDAEVLGAIRAWKDSSR